MTILKSNDHKVKFQNGCITPTERVNVDIPQIPESHSTVRLRKENVQLLNRLKRLQKFPYGK